MFLNVDDRTNIGMVQSSCRFRFLNESRFVLLRRGKMCRKKFERDKPVELGVLGFVDNTHAAFANKFENCVLADRLSDHG